MHLRVLKNVFLSMLRCIVYAVTMTSEQNRSFSLQTFLHFILKFIIKPLIQENL